MFTKRLHSLATNNRTQMVPSRDNNITVINGQQSPVTSSWQPFVMCIHQLSLNIYLEFAIMLSRENRTLC